MCVYLISRQGVQLNLNLLKFFEECLELNFCETHLVLFGFQRASTSLIVPLRLEVNFHLRRSHISDQNRSLFRLRVVDDSGARFLHIRTIKRHVYHPVEVFQNSVGAHNLLLHLELSLFVSYLLCRLCVHYAISGRFYYN